jgi:hypothetical protein
MNIKEGNVNLSKVDPNADELLNKVSTCDKLTLPCLIVHQR